MYKSYERVDLKFSMLRKQRKLSKKNGGINHFSPDFVGLRDMSKLENRTFKENGINAKKYNRSMTPSLYELWILDFIIFYLWLRNHCYQ